MLNETKRIEDLEGKVAILMTKSDELAKDNEHLRTRLDASQDANHKIEVELDEINELLDNLNERDISVEARHTLLKFKTKDSVRCIQDVIKRLKDDIRSARHVSIKALEKVDKLESMISKCVSCSKNIYARKGEKNIRRKN